MSYTGINLEEGIGFEPMELLHSPVFKTGAINHSANLPLAEGERFELSVVLPTAPFQSAGLSRSPILPYYCSAADLVLAPTLTYCPAQPHLYRVSALHRYGLLQAYL